MDLAELAAKNAGVVEASEPIMSGSQVHDLDCCGLTRSSTLGRFTGGHCGARGRSGSIAELNESICIEHGPANAASVRGASISCLTATEANLLAARYCVNPGTILEGCQAILCEARAKFEQNTDSHRVLPLDQPLMAARGLRLDGAFLKLAILGVARWHGWALRLR